MRMEDSICALARSKQCVIVGDQQQLPPSNQFNASTDDDEDDLMRAIGHVHDLNNDRSIQRTAIYTSRIFDVINHLHDSSDNDFQVD